MGGQNANVRMQGENADEPKPQTLIIGHDDGILAAIEDGIRSALPNQNSVALGVHDALRLFSEGTPPGVIIVGLQAASRHGADIITLCRKGAPDSMILAVDNIGDEDSTADALADGADDVIRMPFTRREFEARLRLKLNLPLARGIRNEVEQVLASGAFTPFEASILRFLMERKGRIVTRNQLSQHLYGRDWVYGDRRFDVHITKIRKKLREEAGRQLSVETVRSKGYLLHASSDEKPETALRPLEAPQKPCLRQDQSR